MPCKMLYKLGVENSKRLTNHCVVDNEPKDAGYRDAALKCDYWKDWGGGWDFRWGGLRWSLIRCHRKSFLCGNRLRRWRRFKARGGEASCARINACAPIYIYRRMHLKRNTTYDRTSNDNEWKRACRGENRHWSTRDR